MAVFIITWLPYTAIAMTGKYFNPHDTKGFIVLLMVVICQPSQGLLNVFVYHRQSLARASSQAVGSVKQSVDNVLQRSGGNKKKKTEAGSDTQQQDLDRGRNELKGTNLTITEAAFTEQEEPVCQHEHGDSEATGECDLHEIYD